MISCRPDQNHIYTIDEERRAVQIDHVARLPEPWYIKTLSALTFCSWHTVIAMVGRGPVRGPSHPSPGPLSAGGSC
jgi:hypothetical protein